MAFHPLRTFQKNRKFWMATILLVTMITFVLCTGFQGGDFGAWLLNLVGRNRGEEVTRLNDRAVTIRDLEELKLQREIANDYMRKATQLVMREVELRTEEVEKTRDDKSRQDKLLRMGALQRLLADQLGRPRFFSGGTKLDDLLDFMIWRNQAERLGVRLTDESVDKLVADELYSGHPELRQITGWGTQAAAYAQREVRQSFHQATFRMVVDALADEFRVRIAKMALERSPISTYEPVVAQKLLTPFKFLEPVPQLRLPITPEQMYKYYRENRNEAEIALIPVRVERYLDKVPAPTDADLQTLFDKYRTRKYDPAVEEPGFQQPEQAQVRWVTADPKSKFYTQAARAALTLQAVPPVLYDPMQPLAVAAASYVAHSAAWDASLTRNYRDRRKLHPEKYEMAGLATPYFALPLFNNGLVEPKYKSAPAYPAALVGACAEPTFGVMAVAGYQAGALIPEAGKEDPKPLPLEQMWPILQYERAKRWPIGSTLVLTGAASPFMALGMEHAVAEAPTFLRDGMANYRPGDPRSAPPRQQGFDPDYQGQPVYLPLLGPLKEEIRARIEEKMALRWAQQTMRTVKTRLEAKQGWGGAALTRELFDLQKQLGEAITVGGTNQFRSPYDIGDDPGMVPLKESYERYYNDVNTIGGLGGTAGMLKPDDFSQLFFGGQPFAVGNAAPFTPKPWPPTVTHEPTEIDKLLRGSQVRAQDKNLWEVLDAQLFLFWRTTSRPSAPPETLTEDVRPEVERAWRVIKARDTIVPHLKEVTDALVKAAKEPNADLAGAIRKQAQQQEAKRILLSNVAPLVEREVPAGDMVPKRMIKTYVPYELPRGKILYPHEDTAKAILALRELKEPLRAGDKTLDELSKGLDALNKSLFESTKATGRFIQILTNQPRTVFYVAVLVQPPATVDPIWVDQKFVDALMHGLSFQGPPSNLFVQQCQNAFARDYRRELMAQLRQLAGMTPPTAEAQKRFNTEGPNQ